MLIGTDRLELIPFTPDAIDLLLARDQNPVAFATSEGELTLHRAIGF